MSEECIFCGNARGSRPASIICENEQVVTFIDLRQFHPGHVLVIPREHFHDLRELDPKTGAAVMTMLCRITRAVSSAFPSEGMSVWHSIGAAAFQEVQHLHFHVHPRHLSDGMLRIYPSIVATPARHVRDQYAALIRTHLA